MSQGRGDAVKTVRKLIEVALPLRDINRAAAREKSIRHGHPSTLHLWWSRKPLAAARAVLFAQLVDDPSSRPDLFPTKDDQDRERERLFAILRELVKWENTTNEELLEGAREEIRESWRRTCADNADHPRATELFDPYRPPGFHDPFAGGGTIPLEAQRLGLEAHASDLNPVAVLINKAMIEIPPKFAGRQPVNPESRQRALGANKWLGATGLAEDIRYYGQWMRDEAERRIGHLYPKMRITEPMVVERPDLRPHLDREVTVIAWLWARTVGSPNPAFADVHVPLVSSFLLSATAGKEAYVEPIVDGRNYRFAVRVGPPPASARAGTTAGKRRAFRCLVSDVPLTYAHIRVEGVAGRLRSRLLAMVGDGVPGRIFLSPDDAQESLALSEKATTRLDIPLPPNTRDFKTPKYGMTSFGDLFTDRQLTALTIFSELVNEVRDMVQREACGTNADSTGTDLRPLIEGGCGNVAYATAVALYCAFAVDKAANYWSSLCFWHTTRNITVSTFGRQALPMVWTYAEANPFSGMSGSFSTGIAQISKVVAAMTEAPPGFAAQAAAAEMPGTESIVSTDPPYYDNIGYADLSDFFYLWLRSSQHAVFPDLFSTLSVPKADELVATPYRHGGRQGAMDFFQDGMSAALRGLNAATHPAVPTTIYYAFKQTEEKGGDGTTVSTGWETFLDAVIGSGFQISGTWPMRTEYPGNLKKTVAALASSIVLVCRRRPSDARVAGRNEFIDALKQELPPALLDLQKAGIAPVDLAQAAIGPGMAVFSRYRSVNQVSGEPLTVREALAFINLVLDETLEEQEGDFDGDTRWAVAWFSQYHFDEGEFGDAETLSKAKNTSVAGLVEAGILRSGGGRVRLLRPEELPEDWDPRKDRRRTVWKMVHHLIRVLGTDGEMGASRLLRKMLDKAEEARALAHRLYAVCDRQERAAEAFAYNTVVGSWPEIARLAREDIGKAQALFASG